MRSVGWWMRYHADSGTATSALHFLLDSSFAWDALVRSIAAIPEHRGNCNE